MPYGLSITFCGLTFFFPNPKLNFINVMLILIDQGQTMQKLFKIYFVTQFVCLERKLALLLLFNIFFKTSDIHGLLKIGVKGNILLVIFSMLENSHARSCGLGCKFTACHFSRETPRLKSEDANVRATKSFFA